MNLPHSNIPDGTFSLSTPFVPLKYTLPLLLIIPLHPSHLKVVAAALSRGRVRLR